MCCGYSQTLMSRTPSLYVLCIMYVPSINRLCLNRRKNHAGGTWRMALVTVCLQANYMYVYEGDMWTDNGTTTCWKQTYRFYRAFILLTTMSYGMCVYQPS